MIIGFSKVQKYYTFVKNMYQDLASNTNLIFSYKPQIKVHDLNELNKERLLNETYSLFQIVTEKINNKESQIVIIGVISALRFVKLIQKNFFSKSSTSFPREASRLKCWPNVP